MSRRLRSRKVRTLYHCQTNLCSVLPQVLYSVIWLYMGEEELLSVLAHENSTCCPPGAANKHSAVLLYALQWQVGGWAALICTLQALANMKTKDFDIKQVISAMT